MRDDETVGGWVSARFKASDRTYGARRVCRDVLADGISCGLHKIERLMRAQALRARPRRRGLPKYEGAPLTPHIAPNVFDRRFAAARPNQRWIADFTYVGTAEGWLYVAAVIDLFARRVVGWSMKAEMMAALVRDAIVMAIWRHGKPDALLHHSDRGGQGSQPCLSLAVRQVMTQANRATYDCRSPKCSGAWRAIPATVPSRTIQTGPDGR